MGVRLQDMPKTNSTTPNPISILTHGEVKSWPIMAELIVSCVLQSGKKKESNFSMCDIELALVLIWTMMNGAAEI